MAFKASKETINLLIEKLNISRQTVRLKLKQWNDYNFIKLVLDIETELQKEKQRIRETLIQEMEELNKLKKENNEKFHVDFLQQHEHTV